MDTFCDKRGESIHVHKFQILAIITNDIIRAIMISRSTNYDYFLVAEPIAR
jgi:hypothetical protein